MKNQHTGSLQASGFQCPVCQGFIPVSMQQVLNAERLACPSCQLDLRLNRERSAEAINALKKVQEAEDNVRKASVFKR